MTASKEKKKEIREIRTQQFGSERPEVSQRNKAPPHFFVSTLSQKIILIVTKHFFKQNQYKIAVDFSIIIRIIYM